MRGAEEPTAFPQLAAAPAIADDLSFGQLRRGGRLRRGGLITCLSRHRACTEQARYQQEREKSGRAGHGTASSTYSVAFQAVALRLVAYRRRRCKGQRARGASLRSGACYVSTPTMAPIRQVAIVPDTIDLRPSESTSSRRSGAMVPRPAIMMPSEPKLAKPHMA